MSLTATPTTPTPPAKPKSLLRWQRLLFGALLLLALLASAWWWWRGTEVTVALLERRDFVQTVVASGRVEAPHRLEIAAQISATVTQVPFSEGQTIKAGAILLELDGAELRAQLQQAQAALLQAQGKLRQLREVQGPVAEQSLRQARATLENHRATLKRSQELFKKGFIGQAALDETTKILEVADGQMHIAQRQFESVQSSGSEYALAESAVQVAQAALAAAQARSRYSQIRSPVAGTLLARNVEVGDVVQPGKSLLTVSPSGRTQLVLQIVEKNLRLLALGQDALVSLDAYPQQRFAAKLSFINPAINAQTGAVEVKLDVSTPPAVIRQDMTASVDIQVAHKPQVLLLPQTALHDADSSAPWVLLALNGRAQRREVKLGLLSGGWAEVLHGLQERDLVLVSGDAIKPGARIRSKLPAKSKSKQS